MGKKPSLGNLDNRIMELGQQYWHKMQGKTPSIFDRQYWQGQILDWIMNDESFKVDAFRFVDVLPSLNTSKMISSHVRDYLLKEDRKLPVVIRSALSMASGGIASPLATRTIRANITEMARRFICESDSHKSIAALKKLADNNLTFTADILGEATSSDREAEIYLNKYLDLIEMLATATKNWPKSSDLYLFSSTPQPTANVSVKLSALNPYLDAADHNNSVSRLKERLIPLLRKAKEHNVFINFDLEQWAVHDITYDLFEQISLLEEFRDWPHLGLVIQSYLKTSEQDCDRLIRLSKMRGTPFTIRLVKGAYWDFEVVNARQNGFSCPVYTNKGKTDACYEHLSNILINNHEYIGAAFASHNLRSLVHALAVAEEKRIPKNLIEFQMLYGMAEPERQVLSKDGYRVRVYAPIGELLPGMAYLVRRLLENTSNSSFLRQSHHEGIDIGKMLQSPVVGKELPHPAQLVPGDLHSQFTNTHFLDFTDPEIRDGFSRALTNAINKFPYDIPVIVGGKLIIKEKQKQHPSPNDADLVITNVSQAEIAEAEVAVMVADKAFADWRDKPLAKRAALLDKLADIIEEDRLELAALQCYEVGKPWREADADVAEAIDFCRYYARQSLLELGPRKQGNIAGEDNILYYEGRGPCVVIAPWNFPLAILCGMTVAALVAGNPVIIKPATASSATAHEFYRRLLLAGFSDKVVQFLPGPGKEVGNFVVEHQLISQVAFTGSKEVGLSIIQKSAITHPGQRQVKRVICEMGGKNCIIVDEDADIDAALKGVMQSAFGYAGQKCSACSRLILVGDTYNTFMPRLLDACKSLPISSSILPECRLGPVIDKASHTRLSSLISSPPAGARLIYSGKTPSTGYFIPPTIFEVDNSSNRMLQEEFFGPILTIIRSKTFKAALEIANSTEFALTGGLFSRSPRNLAKARLKFKVGNLYLNRNCTGAMVDRQPFGGFGMSGIGTKAGGPGYLLNFADPRCITENTIRSGFTPDFQM